MKLGVYTAILHDRPLPEALAVIKSLGLEAAEINVGGFQPPVHVPNIDEVIASPDAAAEFLGTFTDAAVELAGLNANGNPLHPNPGIGPRHADDVRRGIRAAAALGQTTLVTMSGLPGGESGDRFVNWVVNPWSSGALDVLERQWDIAVDFWRDMGLYADDHGVRLALELHPHNLVFNCATLERLVERTGAANIGAEMDPSHLFWQGMDPIAIIDHLGPLVFHAAAKDVRLNAAAKLQGVLDERFVRLPADAERLHIGDSEYFNAWPADAAWDFVALGKGHGVDFWAGFLAALARVNPEMPVHIEHEDVSLGPVEGLGAAAEVLRRADGR